MVDVSTFKLSTKQFNNIISFYKRVKLYYSFPRSLNICYSKNLNIILITLPDSYPATLGFTMRLIRQSLFMVTTFPKANFAIMSDKLFIKYIKPSKINSSLERFLLTMNLTKDDIKAVKKARNINNKFDDDASGVFSAVSSADETIENNKTGTYSGFGY